MIPVVRNLTSDDAESLRTIRLATHLHYDDIIPHLHAIDAARPLDYWRTLATPEYEKGWFGLFEDDKMIGVSAAEAWNEDATGATALGHSTWIYPEWRHGGAAGALYRHRNAWVRDSGFSKLVIRIINGRNHPLALAKDHGGKLIFSRSISFADGPPILMHFFDMPINPPRKIRAA